MRGDERLAEGGEASLAPRRFTVSHDDSSRNVTSAEALRLAIRLAVDAGEYEHAEVILSLLKRTE